MITFLGLTAFWASFGTLTFATAVFTFRRAERIQSEYTHYLTRRDEYRRVFGEVHDRAESLEAVSHPRAGEARAYADGMRYAGGLVGIVTMPRHTSAVR